MRELPYGQDVLLENLVDPSHVEYAHHAVFGGRDKHLISRMSIVEAVQQESGCVVHVRDTSKESLPEDSPVTRKIEFKPPTLVRLACFCRAFDCQEPMGIFDWHITVAMHTSNLLQQALVAFSIYESGGTLKRAKQPDTNTIVILWNPYIFGSFETLPGWLQHVFHSGRLM